MTPAELKAKRIGVLLGGLSSEREVSLRTGRAVLEALQGRGYRAVAIDAGRDLAERLKAEQVEVAFIALHGRFGEDGTVQGLLELLGIPYTGSGVLASSMAMDKVVTKEMLLFHGIDTPAYAVVTADRPRPELPGPFPLVVKPAREGSTIGVTIARDAREYERGVTEALALDAKVVVESFVAGSEVTVGVLDGVALPVIQVVPKGGFYDYHSKYTAGQTEYLLPAPLPAEVTVRLQREAERACDVLGCRGGARVDFIVADGRPWCLEVNTIPGMTATSLLPKAAAHAGIPFADLAERILLGAGLGR